MTRSTWLTAVSGWQGEVVVHGHWGRPVLVFPSESGRAGDMAAHGMVAALQPMLDAGTLKLYCVDSADSLTWSDRSQSLEDRARGHDAYERWVLDQVVPFVHDDVSGLTPITTMGCSLGAFHAANLALRHAHVFPRALCLSGSYDPSQWNGWGERGDAAYFHNPLDYVPHLSGEHLDWLRRTVHLVLVVGQGAFEVDPTNALPSTLALAHALAERGIPHDLDVWGHDVPHDWPSWQRQAAHHLPWLVASTG